MSIPNCLKDYVVCSNDERRCKIDCETRDEADTLCAKLNAEADPDTKFWVEVKEDVATAIEFEAGGEYITARNDAGRVLVRCNSSYTDCQDTEPLDAFVARHGEADATAAYLQERYSRNEYSWLRGRA